jgi:hypothetical protein
MTRPRRLLGDELLAKIDEVTKIFWETEQA